MMKLCGHLTVIVLGLLLLGCDDESLMRRYVPPKDEPVARKYLDLLIQGQVDEIEKDLDSTVKDEDNKESLVNLTNTLPNEAPKSVKVVGVRTFWQGGVLKSQITYECEFSSAWYVVEVSLRNNESVWTVLGLRVSRLSDSLENLNRFTFFGKGVEQYLQLGLGACALLLSFYALRVCVQTKSGMGRWMWASFILAGAGRLAINWTTGTFTFAFLSIQVPCVMASKPFYGPWTIAVAFPLGALIFLNEQWKDRVFGRVPEEASRRS